MTRNLILCCDGTGNEIKENQSNVLKFYRVLEKDVEEGTEVEQLAFYEAGVGTLSDSGLWPRLKNDALAAFGLLTGYGLDKNVLDCYRFLCANYRDGDRIFLFGFSRGAYTVRVLGGLIKMVGLLKPTNLNLCDYALTAYKRASEEDDLNIASRVQEVLEARRVTIRFMGCWDTVASMIVPRPDRAYIPSFQKNLPYTKQNPCVQAFRHAISIDERRRAFRVFVWRKGQKFKNNPFEPDEQAIDQDCKQVWFAGVHSDVGGGYPEEESGAAKIPLAWMVEEARAAGLEFREEMVRRLVYGENPPNGRPYVAPDPNADLHYSARGIWQISEWIPKLDKYKEWPARRSFLGMYLPRKEPRFIEQDADIDASVYERRDYVKGVPYTPVNLPRTPS